MLKSIDSNLPELKQLAADDKSLQKLLLDINEDLLTDIISVLEPFDQATRLVSADTVPTLHLVTAIRLQLMKHLVCKPADTEAVVELKNQLSTFMISHFHLGVLLNVALLLYPR